MVVGKVEDGRENHQSHCINVWDCQTKDGGKAGHTVDWDWKSLKKEKDMCVLPHRCFCTWLTYHEHKCPNMSLRSLMFWYSITHSHSLPLPHTLTLPYVHTPTYTVHSKGDLKLSHFLLFSLYFPVIAYKKKTINNYLFMDSNKSHFSPFKMLVFLKNLSL